MGWESSGVVGFDLGPLLQSQMRTAKLKSAYNSLIIGPRGFGALSLWWIQFASVLRCARSSLHLGLPHPTPNGYQYICVSLCPLIAPLTQVPPHFYFLQSHENCFSFVFLKYFAVGLHISDNCIWFATS